MIEKLLLKLDAQKSEDDVLTINMIQGSNGWQASVRKLKATYDPKKTKFAVTPTGALQLALEAYLGVDSDDEDGPNDFDHLI